MNSIRASILKYRKSSKSESEFINSLQQLANECGDNVYIVIFKTLAALDLPEQTAKENWHNIIRHREELIGTLQRDVSLITAISDFLFNNTKYLPYPRLVDGSTFDKIVINTSHDTLTGIFNRTYFDEIYEQQVSLAKRYCTDLSVLFIDIDDFKDVNDSLGHIAGDLALQKVAQAIQKTKRKSDIAARYGGEEFVLLMPYTPNVNACILAERIRRTIEDTEIIYKEHTFSLTISGGLASYPLNSANPEDLVRMADNALYLAKGAGKNIISQFKQEQRRFLRVQLNKSVLIQELGFENNHTFTGQTKNIGMGGLLLTNKAPLPLGSIQKLEVPVNGGNPLFLLGKVVRIVKNDPENYDIGICFTFKEMVKIARNQIADLLKNSTDSEAANQFHFRSRPSRSAFPSKE